jgi:hypothetical protein
VSGYGLDDPTIKVRSPAVRKDFSSSICVQTGSGAHPASCTMRTEGPLPGAKARQGRDADHSPPSVPRSRMSGIYTPLPPIALVACSGTALAFYHSRIPSSVFLLFIRLFSWNAFLLKKLIVAKLCKKFVAFSITLNIFTVFSLVRGSPITYYLQSSAGSSNYKRIMFSFTPWPLYPGRNSTHCPLIRRLSGPQSLCESCCENVSVSGLQPLTPVS